MIMNSGSTRDRQFYKQDIYNNKMVKRRRNK